MKRCVNLDWLEVYCFEPITGVRDADYFRSKGYTVEVRDYGTRIYNEMFTLMGSDEWPLLEVRRSPKSSMTNGGIMPRNACHIRLTNRTCYYYDAAVKLQLFLDQHGFMFQRISRVDVCCDFERFDSGDYPQKFLRRYLQNKFAKLNQGRIHSHGEDTWDDRRWDSISWGSEKSCITTKLYNKSRQLREVKDKPYIKQAWMECGLIDNFYDCTKILKDGSIHKPDIWRVEFSVRSEVKNWFVIEADGNAKKKRSVPNTLRMWAGREQLIVMFASLARHYFHFKIYKEGVRKDQLQDKELFRFGPSEETYKVERLSSPQDEHKDLDRLIAKLNNFAMTYPGSEINAAVSTIVAKIEQIQLSRFAENPYSRKELIALQQTLAYRLQHKGVDPASVLHSILTLLDDAVKPY